MVVGLIAIVMPAAAAAQDLDELRDSRLRLDSIRGERVRLEREMAGLRSRVRDAADEVENIARQRAVSAGALQELDLQVTLLGEQVERSRVELDSTRQLLADRRSSLNSRLRSIYKRGSLHSVRVLLGAENFGDMLNRYKYLHLIAAHDRQAVEHVRRLTSRLTLQQQHLEQALGQLDELRDEKSSELAHLERLERESQSALANYRRAETSAAVQLDEAESAEKGLTDLIARLERERQAGEAGLRMAGGTIAAGSISTRDLGALDWPVEGEIIYRFGPVRKPTGVTLVNKGIGIAAPRGTPVQAVEAGTVSIARPLEGYGPTVMVDHGGGYYTLYMLLDSIVVAEGLPVTAGQYIGTVGGERTPEGPHLYFQVRAPLQAGIPEPVDPLTWLRNRAIRP